MTPAPTHAPTHGLSSAVADRWHVVAALEELALAGERDTVLLGVPVRLVHREDGPPLVTAGGHVLPVSLHYGYVWTSLGEPKAPVFDMPEHLEQDRRNIHSGSFGVHVSAPRAVENFLDMAHFPFVHTDILGESAHPQVEDYQAEVVANGIEILATGCRFYQPRPVASAETGGMVDYVYRVPHPYCAILYKSNEAWPGRKDVIAIFAQPLTEERIEAHLCLSMLDDGWSDTDLRAFQQLIFSQDKPILENQVPKRLPLDLRAEMPARADKAAILYRRWLTSTGIDYGTIPV